MASSIGPIEPYRRRMADAYLGELVSEFPAVMITGPRGVGKTTTASQRVAQIDRLDEPGIAASYRADPDAALRRAGRPLLLDEWQEVPEVLAAVKRVVDRDHTPGQFILTGSVRAQLTTESWAGTGRTVTVSMYPICERELRPFDPPGQSFLDRLETSGLDELAVSPNPPTIDDYINVSLRGGFPEIAYQERPVQSRAVWLESYIDNLVTRDAATADAAKDPVKLRRYLNVLALNNAGVPAEATIYRAADVNAKTAGAYDRLLANLFVLEAVPAWSNSRLNRLVKHRKRYLIDTGLAATAAGLDAATILGNADLVGRYFDAFATAQLRPEFALTHPRPRPHHLRLEGGRHEVDLIVETGGTRIVALEFKAGSAPTKDDARHLAWLRDQLDDNFIAGAVIHAGPSFYQLGDRLYAIPLCSLWS